MTAVEEALGLLAPGRLEAFAKELRQQPRIQKVTRHRRPSQQALASGGCRVLTFHTEPLTLSWAGRHWHLGPFKFGLYVNAGGQYYDLIPQLGRVGHPWIMIHPHVTNGHGACWGDMSGYLISTVRQADAAGFSGSLISFLETGAAPQQSGYWRYWVSAYGEGAPTPEEARNLPSVEQQILERRR